MPPIDFANMSARDILNKLGFDSPPFDPFEIAKAMGVIVNTNIDWEKIKNIKDGKIFLENDNIVIWINPIMPKNRQKFTLAHELGHLVYDILPNLDKYSQNDMSYYRNGDKNYIETRANQFAANLLMPISEISKILSDIQEKDPNVTIAELIDGLVSVLEVSREAIVVRLKRLGVLDDDYIYPYIASKID